MKSYLSSYWNTSIFSGEIISSLFFVLFFLAIKNSKHIKSKVVKIALIAFSTAIAVFIGKGISNIMEPGSSISFAFSLNLIITSIFYDQFELVYELLGAQLIGAVLAVLIYKGYKYVNNVESVVETQETEYKKYSINTFIQQLILVISMFAISFYDYNNGMTPTNTDVVIKNLFVVIVLIVIMIVFANNGFIMLSPIVALAEIFEGNAYKEKIVWKKFGISTSIHLTVAIGVSFGFSELKEIAWR